MKLPVLVVTVGGVTVSMTAVIGHVEWDMGDGSQDFSCDNVTTAYRSSFGTEKPVCGYASGYRAAGTYNVTADAVWGATWTSNIGIGNPVPKIMHKYSGITLTIDQAQALNVAPQETQ
ncbi:hypothetical protein GXW82_20805 [Streptacidiphilus sp. 4-A2]|nr:hypothetical protein [Streptacidiphilus sp. 4-A2]